jgi:hypothetical protein
MEVCAWALVAGYLLLMGKFAISRCRWPILEQQTATTRTLNSGLTREVLSDLLGFSAKRIDELRNQHVIGSFESLSETERLRD